MEVQTVASLRKKKYIYSCMYVLINIYVISLTLFSLSIHMHTHMHMFTHTLFFLRLVHTNTKSNKGRRRSPEVTWSQGFQVHSATNYVWPWASLSEKWPPVQVVCCCMFRKTECWKIVNSKLDNTILLRSHQEHKVPVKRRHGNADLWQLWFFLGLMVDPLFLLVK